MTQAAAQLLAPWWWGSSGPRSSVAHVVQGAIGTTTAARCGKRPNPRTGWTSLAAPGRACLKCLAP